MIQIRNVTKRYGSKKVALNNVLLAIPEKSTVVIAGVNGAGKSTLLKCISGLAPFEGEITIDGFLPDSVESKKKNRILHGSSADIRFSHAGRTHTILGCGIENQRLAASSRRIVQTV
ncbi:MAG: ATP-binding cassette domain-containing protein [Bifidobacteriaceae bacterium]|nr:ATP-binding cassette domain-containing protein [Bifidobacteriaceae bacterium]